MKEVLKRQGGYWISRDYFKFPLSKKIEDVEEFGKNLIKYLKWQEKEGNLPFEVVDMYPLFTNQKAVGLDPPYWESGFVFIVIKKPSLFKRIWPFYNLQYSEESIMINFWKDGEEIISYQERHSEYHGTTYRWKLSLEQIQELKRILNKFCGGHWLGLEKMLSEEYGWKPEKK